MSTEDLFKRIQGALSNLVTLEIRTIVGDVTHEENPLNPDGPKIITPVSGQSDSIESQINMLQGDITTAMSDKFLTDPTYAPLRKFQEEREQQGHKTIMENIEALKKLIGLISTVDTKAGAQQGQAATQTTANADENKTNTTEGEV